ncbi:MAG: hypothetical protein WAM97_12400 [Acidimicrobiales bacterium]
MEQLSTTGAILVETLIGLDDRIRVEEKVLIQDPGDRYSDFAKSRKRLIAFIR